MRGFCHTLCLLDCLEVSYDHYLMLYSAFSSGTANMHAGASWRDDPGMEADKHTCVAKASLLPAGLCNTLAMRLLNLRIHKLLQLFELHPLLGSLHETSTVSAAGYTPLYHSLAQPDWQVAALDAQQRVLQFG